MATYEARSRPSTPEQRAKALRALRAFLFHVATNNRDALRALLSEDVVMLNDGAGEFFAAKKPVVGWEKILNFHRKIMRPGRPRLAFRVLNGAPSLIIEFPPWKQGTAERMVAWVERLDRAEIG